MGADRHPAPPVKPKQRTCCRRSSCVAGCVRGLVDIWDSEVRTQHWLAHAAPTSGGPEPPGPTTAQAAWHRCLLPGDPFFRGTLAPSMALGSGTRGWGTGCRGVGRAGEDVGLCTLEKPSAGARGSRSADIKRAFEGHHWLCSQGPRAALGLTHRCTEPDWAP